MDITTPVKGIKGVGAKTEQLFQKTGVYTIGDILLRFPREYAKYPVPVPVSRAQTGQKQAVILQVESPAAVKRTRTMQITVCTGHDGDVYMEFLWFRMPYIRNTLQKGQTYILYGNVQDRNGQPVMEQPAI